LAMGDAATVRFEATHTLIQWPGQLPVALTTSPAMLAATHWPQGRPTPLGIEQAIDAVEDAIERAGLHHGDHQVLRWPHDEHGHLADLFGSQEVLSRDLVEAHFTRMAAQAPSWSGASAAALLMLRELMHHLGFQLLMR
jgi:hypothetical protein